MLVFRFAAFVYCFAALTVTVHAREHYTVRLKLPRDFTNPKVQTLVFSPDGSELAVATNRNLQFIRSTDGNVIKRVEITPFSVAYSKDGSRFYAITTRQHYIYRTSDKAPVTFSAPKEYGFIGIRLGHKNGKLIISHVDAGSPAMESEQVTVGDELIAVAHGAGVSGKYINVVGRTAEQATREMKGLAGTHIRLKTIPRGSLDERVVTLQRRAATSVAGTRRWKKFEPFTVADNLASCISGGYHELRLASTGQTVSAFHMRNLTNTTGLSAISPDSRYFAWVGQYLITPDEARKLRERTAIDNQVVDLGGSDAAQVAGAAYDDLGLGADKRFYGTEIYDIGSRKLVATFPIAVDPKWGGKVHRGVEFSSDSSKLIVGTATRIHVYDIASGRRINEIEITREPDIKSNYSNTVFKTDVANGVVAAASYVGSVRLVDLETGEVFKRVSGRDADNTVSHVALSNDATKLAFHLNGVIHLVHLSP